MASFCGHCSGSHSILDIDSCIANGADKENAEYRRARMDSEAKKYSARLVAAFYDKTLIVQMTSGGEMINGMAKPPDEQCGQDGHVWSRYFVSSVARSESAEIDTKLSPADVKDFSVCDKCHMVCYVKPLKGLISTSQSFYCNTDNQIDKENDNG